MKRTRTIALLATLGLGVGAANAAPPASHGNREPGQSMTAQERTQLVAAVRRNTNAVKQPKTHEQALATLQHRADGTSVILVPEVLWSNLSMQKDARGALHLRESEGTAPATTLVEGAPHE
jgi:hypothetical protein